MDIIVLLALSEKNLGKFVFTKKIHFLRFNIVVYNRRYSSEIKLFFRNCVISDFLSVNVSFSIIISYKSRTWETFKTINFMHESAEDHCFIPG